ncbi:unnamed protein product [Phytophthora fragariaefolia]|uniref:Unnamed protein product n=1 Tax=Phytophthora fragariaefolia TaxID=1490495 RepID=A0A9W6TXC4_9STRA|nr:unnamed protein product [Phytophthora fragariaefolia]
MHKKRDPSRSVDSGTSRHLVNDASVLHDVRDAGIASLTEQEGNAVPKVGPSTFRGEVNVTATTITLSDVYYARSLAHNLLFLGKLANRGCTLTEANGRPSITDDKPIVFKVNFANDVLVADLTAQRLTIPAVEMLALAVLLDPAPEHDVHYDTRMGPHRGFGDLGLDTAEHVARHPLSGIVITDHTRSVCVTCAEGKQAKRRQSKKGSREYAPIDLVGGVTCNDIEEPLTQRDRSGIRYLANFVDHRSSSSLVFASKTKYETARKFLDFLVFFREDVLLHSTRPSR